MDILYIDQLTVMAKIGIYPWEKKQYQKLTFDLKILHNNNYKIKNIHKWNYLDYTQINQVILDIINTEHFLLIEDVAEVVAKTLIKKFPIISQIQVQVNKPGAMYNVRNVGICINRKNLNNMKRFKIYTDLD